MCWLSERQDALLLRFEGGRIGIHSTTLTTPPRRDMAVIEGTLGRISIESLEFGGDHIMLETPVSTHRQPRPDSMQTQTQRTTRSKRRDQIAR